MKTYFYFLFIIFLYSCSQPSFNEPIVNLDAYQIHPDFELKAIASEPFIEAPVTLDIDEKGRLWVVEMRGYMQNLEGTGEHMPNGRIVILEDLDHDGVTDHSTVFLDSLVLPRAIAHVYGGLLYAEPPNLWFVDIVNDKPTNKVLVDDKYVTGGNVEHQPNGLMMHIDNWIYNAKSSFRYQRRHGKWIKERTYFRGQWGITKDNFGRLYHNNNSVILKGDLVLPNTFTHNPNYKPEQALGKKLNKNQRVYPLHATSVNRGYIEGRLDKDSVLVNVTATCGPLIYRGDAFADAYHQNAFICAPEANVIKRNVLNFSISEFKAIHPTPKKEFLAATDEGFRPVNLFNAPDGSIYVVDMHRGIIQDKAYLTPYLKKHYQQKQLDTVIGMGRILKIHPKDFKPKTTINLAELRTSKLIPYLSHTNGWYRDKAQQLLVYRQDFKAVPLLQKLISKTNLATTQIHALHTLNGLEALTFDFLNELLQNTNTPTETLCHAIVLLEQHAHPNFASKAAKSLQWLVTKNKLELDLYVASSLQQWIAISPDLFFPILIKIAQNHPNNSLVYEGILSSLYLQEQAFKDFATQHLPLQTVLYKQLDKAITQQQTQFKNQQKKQTQNQQKAIKAGKITFDNLCANCHGEKGEGIASLAPPFVNSEYISESTERLASVILHGLSGPIKVNGIQYDLTATMPGLANNPDYSDQDIQNIIAYLQHTFSDDPKPISIQKIKKLRTLTPKNGVYSEKELLQIR